MSMTIHVTVYMHTNSVRCHDAGKKYQVDKRIFVVADKKAAIKKTRSIMNKRDEYDANHYASVPRYTVILMYKKKVIWEKFFRRKEN